MSYLKPQTPIKQGDDYIYPLTTADQVIVGNGGRLSSLFRKTIKTTVNLLASNWSESAPYTQTITVDDNLDDYKVDANIVYSGDKDNDSTLNKAASSISYIKKSGKEITFYCLNNKPEIDIPIEITCTCRNTIATVNVEEGIELPTLTNEGTSLDLLLGKQLINQDGNIVTGSYEGVELNFKVVGGTSEPTNPDGNTVWVNTDTEITSYVFSATEPETPIDGMVWITTSTSSTIKFNALKKNGIYISPTLAKQYLNSGWTDVKMNIYQSGEWDDGTYYLYTNGDERTDITGGWGSAASYILKDEYGSYAGKAISVSRGTSSIKITASASTSSNSSGQSGLFYAINKIDLTNFKTLYMDGSMLARNFTGTTGIYIRSNLGHYYSDSYVARKTPSNIDSRETKVFSIDVSGLSGEYYICLACGAYNKKGTSEITMNSMWLEV